MTCLDQLRCSRENWLWCGTTTSQFITLRWNDNLGLSVLWRLVTLVYFLSHLAYNYYMYCMVDYEDWDAFPLAYLTKWTELTNCFYALLSFWLVVCYALKRDRSCMEQEASVWLKFLGFLWEVQSTITLAVAVMYYALVKVIWKYTSINTHLTTGIIIAIDLFMIRTPRKLYHVWAPQIYLFFLPDLQPGCLVCRRKSAICSN